MAQGYGYHIQQKNEPNIYLTGDTILTEAVSSCITQHQPDVVIIPAGGAKFDLGDEASMGLEDAIKIGEITGNQVMFNHLESLDCCRVTRNDLYHEIHILVGKKGFMCRVMVKLYSLINR